MKPMNVKESIRIKAWYIDMVFLIPFMFLEIIILLALFGEKLYVILDNNYLIQLVFIVPYLLINEFFTKNGSIGKKIMKIKIINKENENRPNKFRLLLRGVGNAFLVIDALFCYKRADRRSLGDIISKTRVIYATVEQQVKHENINLDEWKWNAEAVTWDDSYSLSRKRKNEDTPKDKENPRECR